MVHAPKKKKPNKIDRRKFLQYAGIGAAGAYAMNAAGCGQSQPAKGEKPNIIFILADDLGYGDLGCYGQRKIGTPCLDQMAAEGIRFTSCYCGSPVCAPSRCTLMTGYHTGHARIRGNISDVTHKTVSLGAGDVTLPEVLKSAGYATGMCGKWGLGDPGSEGVPWETGFDYFYGYLDQRRAHHYYPEYLWENDKKVYFPDNRNGRRGTWSQDVIGNKALDFIDRNKDKRFFLYLPFTAPHAELLVPEKYLDQYKGKFPEKPFPGEHGYHAQRYPHAAYAAMVSRLDQQAGDIFARLKQHGIDEKTIVFFSSDNGPSDAGGIDPEFFKSNGPLRGAKRDLYEGGIRIPMIVRQPGRIAPGLVSSYPWAFWDFLPTAAELAGADAPAKLDGMSVVNAIYGRPQKDHKYLYWEFEKGNYFKRAARAGRWKGIELSPGLPLQLYDLETDLGEKIDVAESYPGEVAKIKKIFDEAHTKSSNWPLPRAQVP